MELSKVLLGALLLGIAVETSSCGRKCYEVQPAGVAQNGPHETTTPNNNPPDSCPACGMG